MKKAIFPFILLLLISFIFTSCNDSNDKKLTIAVNPWIGYTPLIYIKESGWIKDKNIDIVNVISLFESVKMLESDMIHAIGGTQQEYDILSNTVKAVPVFIIDRSFGADAIFSNLSVDELKNTLLTIDVYMELGTINELLFNLFVKKYHLEKSTFNLIDLDQFSISKIKNKNIKPKILVSYEPYLADIKANGFKRLDDTRSIELIVVDSLLITPKYIKTYSKELKELNILFKNALTNLKNNPKEYYTKIRSHLNNQSYEEFLESLEGIEWIYKTTPRKMIDELKKQNLETEFILNETN